MIPRDIIELWILFILQIIQSRYIYGFPGRRDSASTYTMAVPGRTGYIYVRIWNGQEVTLATALNMGGTPNPNVLVRMERRNGILVVVDADPSHALNTLGENVAMANVPKHRHFIGSGNEDPIEGRRFVPGLLAPSSAGGLNVHVFPFFTKYGYVAEDSSFTIDDPSTPGTRAWVVVYADSSNVLQYTVSTTHVSGVSGDLDESDIPSEVTLPDGATPVGAVVVSAGGSVTNASQFADYRFHFDESTDYAADIADVASDLATHEADTTAHGATGAVVGTTNTQTLTNKTIDGDDNTIQDVPLSAIKTVGANTNRTITRNGSGVISDSKSAPTGDYVGTTDTQTLTNKTMTSPVINTGDINTPDIDGGTIDSTPIGGTTPATGTFTDVTATTAGGGSLTANGTNNPMQVVFRFRRNSLDRWRFGTDGATESTGNAGSNFGIFRHADDGSFIETNFGITRSSGNALFSQGLHVTGALSKGSGTFTIPHPLDKNYWLHHSFIEGPRCDLIYRGTVQLVNGVAVISIDAESNMREGTFAALTQNPQFFLQNQTGFSAVRGAMGSGILSIECEDTNSTDTISWMVVAERADDVIKKWELTDENGRLIPEQRRTVEQRKTTLRKRIEFAKQERQSGKEVIRHNRRQKIYATQQSKTQLSGGLTNGNAEGAGRAGRPSSDQGSIRH